MKDSYTVKELIKRSKFLSYIYISIFTIAGFTFIYLGINKCLVKVTFANVMVVVMSLGFMIADIIFIKIVITNTYGTGIQDYFTSHQDVAIEDLDNDFRQANHFVSCLWIGNMCTFHIGYLYPYIIENKEIIWIYITRISGKGGGGWSINFCDINKKMTSLIIKSEKKADAIARLYEQTFSHIVVGYSKDLKNEYNENLDNFLNIKYNEKYK